MESRQPSAEIAYYEIACQQVLEGDESVFSIQWVVLPAADASDLTTERLLEFYLAWIRRFTLTLVRPAITMTGIEFRLFGSLLPLLTFTLPRHEQTPHGERAVLQITGGVLVQPRQCDRGELELRVERVAAGVKLTLQLSDYCPLLLGSPRPSRWRKWLYRLTQAYIHKVVTVRFLARIYRQVEGVKPGIRVVRVVLREGENI